MTASPERLEGTVDPKLLEILVCPLTKGPLESLLRQAFGGRLVLEKAVRTWATLDPVARSAVQAIDRRRLGYVESLFKASGLSDDVARARAQIIYWAFLGFALSDKPLPPARQAEVLDELLRIATARS